MMDDAKLVCVPPIRDRRTGNPGVSHLDNGMKQVAALVAGNEVPNARPKYLIGVAMKSVITGLAVTIAIIAAITLAVKSNPLTAFSFVLACAFVAKACKR